MLSLSKMLSRAAVSLGLVALVMSAAGCIVEIEDPIFDPLYLADMQVRWTVNGSSDPSWCDELGVETWIVEARGPEARDVVLDCRSDYWDTDRTLGGLEEGDYRIRLVALDLDGFEIAVAGARIYDLIDEGGVDVIDIRLSEFDF